MYIYIYIYIYVYICIICIYISHFDVNKFCRSKKASQLLL